MDAPDFPTALRAAMRQAPDVIVVGEMRDPETMRMALSAAETGHLVLTTVHTTDAASAVSRIADSFPLERQATIRQELSMALAAILTQTLLPRKGGGRAAAAELLYVSYGARQHVRKNALQHLHQEIALTKKQGSITLEESLAKLVREGVVEAEDARARAAHPEEFENYLRGSPPAARISAILFPRVSGGEGWGERGARAQSRNSTSLTPSTASVSTPLSGTAPS